VTLSNLQLRLASAVVGIPTVVALILIGGWPFALAAGIVALLAAAEFVHGFLMPSRPLSSVWGLAPGFGATAIMVAGSHQSPQFIVVGIGFAVALILAGYSRTNLFGPRKPLRVLAGAFLYIGALLSMLVLLRNETDGRDWVLLAILATFAVDTGAYAVGRTIGRHKMAPRISPAKTWEGAVGGYAAGAGAVFALVAIFGLDVDAGVLLPLALMLPPAAIVGDLFESWLKRRMGIKDASGFIPGHGGFMDRLDSILFVAPVVYVFVTVLLD
jgi:phosphatidate cytidylyltransferase